MEAGTVLGFQVRQMTSLTRVLKFLRENEHTNAVLCTAVSTWEEPEI